MARPHLQINRFNHPSILQVMPVATGGRKCSAISGAQQRLGPLLHKDQLAAQDADQLSLMAVPMPLTQKTAMQAQPLLQPRWVAQRGMAGGVCDAWLLAAGGLRRLH